jgi:GAF domain-containing protein
MVVPCTQLRSVLIAEAERARIAVGAECSSISRWERDAGVMRTLVNAGWLLPSDERFPKDEIYPLESFPAIAELLRERRAVLNPADVSSAAVAAQQRYGSHAGVPIVVDGECWGELWAARGLGHPPLTRGDVDQLRHVADRLGDVLSASPSPGVA